MLSPEFLAIGGGSSGYAVKNSLRFRASNSAYLERTPAGAGNRKTWTWSAWVKRGTLGGATSMNLFVGDRAGTTDATYTSITFTTSDQLAVAGYATNWRITTAVFRDPTAWMHIVVALDTTQATAGDRVKVYVNGTQVTAFGTSNNPALNADLGINQAALHALGRDVAGGPTFFDGHMAHVYLIDGQALTPSSFGRTDAATGEWVPTNYSGSYGTNGFRLSFEDATSTTTIGYDSSGAANHMTTSGISVTSGVTFDQSLDTPTLNYAVWSPIDRGDTGLAVTNGNLGYTISNAASGLCRATFAASTGKWYWEMTAGADWTASPQHGISPVTASNTGDATAGNGYGWESAATSRLFSNGSAGANYGTQISNGDVLMIAVDFDAGKIWYGRNGTWFGSPAGDPAAGTNQSQTITTGVVYAPVFGRDSSSATTTNYANFGQRAFSYTPPTGFAALNTRNLPTPSIKRSRQYFDTRLRTGTGAAASVADLEFAPDLVWIKSRSAATDHGLYDAVRGVQKQLESNTTTGETTETTGLTAFNSNGYTVGSLAQLNTSAATYVDWAWKEGATPGFDIVTYTGNGTNRTISHALGAVPKFMVVKRLDTGNGWVSYHASQNASPATGYMYLNSTAGFAAASTMWNNTAPTSSVFSVGTNSETNGNTFSFVGYLWSEIEGFSKFGSYTGNGSTDGPFVWCGFRPRWVMIKRSDTTGNWVMLNTAMNQFNVADLELHANLSLSENANAANDLDFLSSGFKIRNTNADYNASGGTYVFAAFAEVPFKYARAR